MDGIGISIEGIGYPLGTGSANEAGTVWALEARPAPTDTSPDGADEYEWREGLVGPVVPSGVEVDPLTADLTVPRQASMSTRSSSQRVMSSTSARRRCV